jgi:UDP-3-O-[3-hydroxymyristoyl] glucosamine N-acyltransferase
MKCSVQEIADAVGGRVHGDGTVAVTGVASLQSASAGDLVFIEDAANLGAALESRAAAVVAGDFAAANGTAKPLILTPQPKLAFARAVRLLKPSADRDAGIHPSAVVHPQAVLGEGVVVEERAVVHEGAQIGAGTRIGAGCVVGAGVRIGAGGTLWPNVTIYPGTRIGQRVVLHAGVVLGSDGFGYVLDRTTGRYENFPQVGGLEVGDDVEIGANSTVDRGALDDTRIGRGTKIDNLVHVGHNVQIGENVIICAQAGFGGSTVVENGAIIGGQVGIADHVRIGEGALLGAQAGVPTNKVIRGKGVVFWGTPARPIREYLKELAVLARLSKKS